MIRENIHTLYDLWTKENIRDGGDLWKTINRIEEIKPSRSKQCQLDLIGHVTALCFYAANYGSKEIEDWAKKNRDFYKNIVNQIPIQKKAANEILSFFGESQDIANDAIEIGYGLSESPLPSNIKLVDLLENYKKGLDQILKDIKEEPLLCWRVFGALEYPQKLRSQTYCKQPELNSFLFNSAFLFRHFTNTDQDDTEWLPIPHGEMPTFGKPCNPIISGLAISIFPSLELGEKDISKRIDRLEKQKARLTCWVNTPL